MTDHERELANLREQIAVLEEQFKVACERCEGWRKRAEKAEAFKTWVHQYLDAHGIPHHPPGTHGAAGCRIGDRMDWLMEKVKRLRAENAEIVGIARRIAALDFTPQTAVQRQALEALCEWLRGCVWSHTPEPVAKTLCDQRDALEAEVTRLKKLLDRDHTGIASALVSIRRVLNGYSWIPGGEWGCYEHHERTEEALREEVGRAFEAIDATAKTALSESGTRAGAAFVPDRDKLASAEAEVARLRLLLVRKSEALGVFADPKCWFHGKWVDRYRYVWNGDGDGACRDPGAFARREATADEPCD